MLEIILFIWIYSILMIEAMTYEDGGFIELCTCKYINTTDVILFAPLWAFIIFLFWGEED